MAYTTINKSTDYFDTKTFTGTASSQSITGLNFKPSLVWLKNRDSAYAHSLFDLHRGTNARIRTESTNAQDNPSPSALTAFNSNGFTVGADIGVNQNNENIVSWNWYAADSMGSSNTDGSLNSYATTVNTTAGFSIISYTGTGSNATIGHGLGVAPKVIIVKSLSGGGDWTSYHSVLGHTKFMRLNSTNTVGTQSSYWNDTAPTSAVFSIGTAGDVNSNGTTYIAYCFAEKTGYSKFGKYTGDGTSGTNPNVDGPFIYTGFKPKWILIKHSGGGTAAGEHWNLQDVKRSPNNPSIVMLSPNQNSAENSTNNNGIDFLSNGFKIRNNDGRLNNSGASYIYMAFGQSLVGTNNVPCTAR